MKKLIATLILAACLSPVHAMAGESDLVYGFGSVAGGCGIWTAEKNSDLKLYQRSWVLGYISAISVHPKTPILRETNSDAIFGWIDNYCKAEPLDDLANAAQALSFALEAPAIVNPVGGRTIRN